MIFILKRFRKIVGISFCIKKKLNNENSLKLFLMSTKSLKEITSNNIQLTVLLKYYVQRLHTTICKKADIVGIG